MTGKHEVSVVICGKTEQDADNEMNAWIKRNPNEELVLRFKPQKAQNGEKWCGSLVVRSDKEWLPSDSAY
jgi:hypothetical protein